MSLRMQRLLVMVVVLLLGMWLRVHRLVEIPPGVHFDEAANGLLAGDIGLRGARPIFIKAYTGKETLFFYLAGSVMFLLGQSVFALRLTAAFVGLLTVSATDWLCRELFPRRRWIGVFAALLLATNFVMVLFGRLGFRAITQPLFQTLTIAALLYGVRTGKRRGFVLGGVCLGLTGYTYLAARLFPIVVAVVVLWLVGGFLTTEARRKRGGEEELAAEARTVSYFILHISSFFLMAFVVVLPLLWFFWQNPDAFWVRIEQVSGDVGWRDYVGSYIESVGMIAFEGDPYIRFNVPGRGVLRPVVAIVSGLGMVVLVWRRWWFGVMLVVAGVGVMLLPTALAIGEITPSNLRAIGVFPFVLLPFGVGVDWLMDRPKMRKFKSAKGLLCLVLVVGLGWGVYGDYFVEWGQREDVFYESEGDLVAVARYLDEVGDVGRIFVASEHYQHPSLSFLSERYDEIEWLVGGEALVFGGDGVVVYPARVGVPEWVGEFLPQRHSERREFVSYDVGEFLPQRHREFEADFSGAVVLDGVDVVQSGNVMSVQLFWTVGRGTERAVIPFVHLEDENGYRWGQNDSIGFLAEQWRPGDQIIYNVELEIPEGMPSGAYRLQIGLFDGERLAVVDEAGRFAGTTVIVDDLFVEGNRQYSGEMPLIKVDEGAFLGHGGVVETVEAGASFPLELWWLDGESDVVLMVGDVIVDSWGVDGGFVVDRRVVGIPADLDGGVYNLYLANYRDTEGAEILLGAIEVLETDRVFVRPEVGIEVEAVFGDEIGLVGYTVDGGKLEVVWEALRAPSEDYTVFVHLLDVDGTCCVWQMDSRPQQNTYPTIRWIEGEFVVDVREVDLPEQPGVYPIEIGLYVAETGERLLVRSSDVELRDYFYLSPIVVE